MRTREIVGNGCSKLEESVTGAGPKSIEVDLGAFFEVRIERNEANGAAPLFEMLDHPG